MIIDQFDKSIQIKIVFFGAAMSGKSKSLRKLFSLMGKQVLSIDSTVGRTLLFDYGTVSVKDKQWNIKFHIYSTTGPEFYQVTRCDILRASDGIIFVIDSQKDVWDRNLKSWNELKAYFGDRLHNLPIVAAFNKTDLIDRLDTSEFLNNIGYADFDNLKIAHINAINGDGIIQAFEKMLKLVLGTLYIIA